MVGMREAVLKVPAPEGVREVAALPEAGFVRQRDILPWEKLVMGKAKNVRGAFPFPWVCASFFNVFYFLTEV